MRAASSSYLPTSPPMPAWQERRADLTDRARGDQTHRRPVWYRARHQRTRLRRTSATTAGKPSSRTELEAWMRAERARLSRSSPVAEPIDYMLKRWEGFTAFLGEGRICLTNNAAERALRGFAISGSFCPCWAGGRSPLSLASVFRTPASLREQRRTRQRSDHSSRHRAGACHYRSGLDDRSRGVRSNGSGIPARVACCTA